MYYPYYNIQAGDLPKPIPAFVLKTAPAREPVELEDVKSHSRIDIDEDDILIQAKIIGVRKMVERMYDLAMMTQTWTMYVDFLPVNCIEIWKRPVQSVTSVKYLADSGTLLTLDPATYTIDINSRPPRIVRGMYATWPYVTPRPSAIAVEFIAGYGDKTSDVPEHVQMYLLTKIADFYENRESYTEQTIQPLNFIDNLMNAERLFTL